MEAMLLSELLYYRIDDLFHVKLTDLALSRDFFPNDYHCLGDNENRPIKWMAIESLTRREFSTASDIVSLDTLHCFVLMAVVNIC